MADSQREPQVEAAMELPATDRGFHLSGNAHRVLEARYLRRDTQGRPVESPEELVERVARGVAHAELLLHGPAAAHRWEERFRELLLTRDFLPNSPTLMNAGTQLGQLSACFVLPVPDSMEGIFEALKTMAMVQRTGGGTGFAFSRLRPRGDRVTSTAGTTPGPLAFLRIFDTATENIRLGGRRRGANMGVLRVDHPDVLDFIEAKADEGALRNFNLSVAVTDAFMTAAGAGEGYDLVNPRTGDAVGRADAADVLSRIAEAAWRTGDPGLLFLDAIQRAQPTPQLGEIEATNPCGEVPLLPYESCNLGSIHLGHMVSGQGERARLDVARLRETVRVAIRFLDDVIQVNRYPASAIAEATLRTRKIGLGVMGFADFLIRLGVSYDSDRAVELGGSVMESIEEEALEASRELAELRGVYPAWTGSRHEAAGLLVRNATRTSVAPTGTISILADTTASIEPLFAVAYRRTHVLEEVGRSGTIAELNPLLVRALDRRGLDRQRILESVLETGTMEGTEGIPPDLHRLFVTALEMSPERHLAVQAAFQRHTDNAVSKTVNLSESATPSDIAHIYRRAWELGLKGITVYRFGSRSEQVVKMGLGEEPYQFEHGHSCDPTECRL
jgi:ribonucleoside-diphosphate reductase alpha chain